MAMKSIKQIAHHSLHHLGNAATKRIIKQFAAKYSFVYFGFVDPREDEYELVRGVTVSTTHVDNHYTVGSYNGHDIIVVERRNKLTFPGKPDTTYKWLIMQADLKRGGLPHIFIDTRHHDAVFYANAFTASSQMQDITQYVVPQGTAFAEHCKLWANPALYQTVAKVVTPEIAETLARHFNQFDYEFFEDRVLVYACNTVVTPLLLQDMLRISIWLAEQCNALETE